MLFSIGTRVRFRHSQDSGVVTALLDDGMVNVRLDDHDMEIPAFPEDLIRLEAAPGNLSPSRAKIVPGKEKKTATPPRPPEIETQYTILKSRGIQLAFDPIEEPGKPTERYHIYLLNDTPYDVLYSFRMDFRHTTNRRKNGKLSSLSFIRIGELLFDQLNDAPTVQMECWRITTEGTGKRLDRRLRIRPKQFFNRITTAPLLNRRVHLFKIFEKLTAPGHTPEREEDLRSYTRRKAQTVRLWDDIRERLPHDVLELAEFIPEIDLHAEKLTDYHHKMSNAEILRLQLRHFDAYIDRALRVGAERVFVIHGVGKGRLRDAIASRLIRMPGVDTFKNEYHPRYGWGATEVIFE